MGRRRIRLGGAVMSLYTELKQAGCDIDHHETDLYVRDSETARAILGLHGKTVDGWNVQRFTSAIDSTQWLDIPFMYEPGWPK